MEQITVALNNEAIKCLDNAAIGITNLLNFVFQPGTINYNKLAYELQREFKAGGSPDITRISFDRVKYDPVIDEGNFRIVLDISFTFGCEDVKTTKSNQTSEWTFNINKADKLIHLYNSPFAESRSTADEF